MKLHDTLTGQKRDFTPAGDTVKLYVCGVSPYSSAHVGHALSYVFFDVMRRYLEYRGYRVRHIQNFTDVEDNIIAAAQKAGTTIWDLTEGYIREYLEDMDTLHVLRAHEYPKATEMVPQIVEMVRGLIDKGFAYAADGDVYFRVTRVSDYGKLSHRTLDGMMAGARVEVVAGKEHPMDFALWKAAKPGEPTWESPWGPGRPGWHIECSAMSLHLLGTDLDIHGGGQDLVFPHHENEIAQSEAYTGQAPLANFWLHNGLLRQDENKMSKSLGNLVTIRDALSQVGPDALRLYLLSSHYRNSLTYSAEGLAAQARALGRLQEAAALPQPAKTGEARPDATPFRERFLSAMDDDLNTPQALAALFDLARETNRLALEDGDIAEAQETLRELAGVLGLSLEQDPAALAGAEPFLDLLVEMRQELRAARQFELADRLRQRLQDMGVALEDTPQGTRWKIRAGGH